MISVTAPVSVHLKRFIAVKRGFTRISALGYLEPLLERWFEVLCVECGEDVWEESISYSLTNVLTCVRAVHLCYGFI